MLDFRIATFLRVCQTMNFTRAARDLGLTQPAVTQHIHYLETYYGVKLFHYEKKTLTLTPQGKLLYTSMNAMANDEKKLRKSLVEKPSSKPLISLGTTMTIGEYALPSLLASYIETHPHFNFHVHYGNTNQLLTLLDRGDISLALIEGYYPKEKYGHRTYKTEKFICVAGAGHSFKMGPPKKLDDLFSERLLLREKGSGTREILERNLRARGRSFADFPSFIELENMHALIQLLSRKAGLSFLYEMAAREGLEKGLLQEIHLADFSISHDFDFVWDKNSIYAGRALELAKSLA